MSRRSFFTRLTSAERLRAPSSYRSTLPTVSSNDLPPVSVIALNRMGFGPKPNDVDEFEALGSSDSARLNAYIDMQTAPASVDDSAFEALVAAANLSDTLEKDLTTLWQDHISSNPAWQERIRPLIETERMTMSRAIHSKRQLQEVLSDFWHNHFNLYGLHYMVAPLFVNYDQEIIRPHIFGNFREMLGAVAQSPQMLYYLDGFSNKVAGPNENFA
ncbi:MAG: DUF1800 family protein, partial [Chloroflexota bacterium]